MKKFLIGFLLVITGLVIFMANSKYEYLLTAISRTYLKGHTTANIDDYTEFNTRVIESGDVQPWPETEGGLEQMPADLKSQLESNNAVAFLAFKDGKLIMENYFHSYSDTSRTNSFSMAKTVTTLLLGCAIEDGLIEGMDQKVADFIPEFAADEKGKNATIEQLCNMTSGYAWDEAYYSPFSPTVRLLYGEDVSAFLVERGFDTEPGSQYYYSSASTMLLGMVVNAAIKKQDPETSLSAYLSKKLWKPLGMNADALWHLDEAGIELAYCCISTNARNYGKLGQLLLQDGKWKGEQLVDSAFVVGMRTPSAVSNYGYSTWINNENSLPYYGYRGHLGQFITVVPDRNLVLVRLGKDMGKWKGNMDGMLQSHIEAVTDMWEGDEVDN